MCCEPMGLDVNAPPSGVSHSLCNKKHCNKPIHMKTIPHFAASCALCLPIQPDAEHPVLDGVSCSHFNGISECYPKILRMHLCMMQEYFKHNQKMDGC